MPPHVVVLTGASGVGKTAAVEALASRHLPGVECFHFDSIGVPTAAEMQAAYGGGENWQAHATKVWLARLRDCPTVVRVAVLDAQVRPSVVQRISNDLGLTVTLILLECDATRREARFRGARNQPELINEEMDRWAAYLRGQADALGLAVIDTSERDIAEVADQLCALLGIALASASALVLLERKQASVADSHRPGVT